MAFITVKEENITTWAHYEKTGTHIAFHNPTYRRMFPTCLLYTSAQRYGNLFDMYEEITDVSPYENPMMIYPAIHYTMGGIWVDYELMTSIKGLFAIGECNFSDHGANRLGASALMQGLADGYFVLPYTIQNYLADQITVPRFSTDLPEFAEAEKAVQAKICLLYTYRCV